MKSPTHTYRTAVRGSVSALLRSRFVAALSEPRGIDHYVSLVAPTWSASEVRARVVGVRRETSDTVSLLLEPNHNWRGFRAGQHVSLTVTLDGVCHTRTFSISSSPRSGTPVRLTIRAFPGGLVSNWAVHRARRGDVVVLGAAQGDFVVPRDAPQSLLFVSGGSGITPVVSMVRELLYSGYAGEITALHYARNEIILHDELTMLAEEFPNFRFLPQLTSGADARPHFSRATLEAELAGFRDAETFVCGPSALEDSVTELWRREGLEARLHTERFTARVNTLPSTGKSRKLTFVKSDRSVQGHDADSLLVQAETAGLRPAYGCRMGVCHTCKCKKHSGVVRNLQSGELSDAGPETIRLCVSVPESDVVVEL
jgi:stearoyl-CoA 9-desaturase NADPH oxidoreductase